MAKGANKVSAETPSNTRLRQEVTRQDLPLHCPMPGTSLWNSHPRVYLPIEDSGESAGATNQISGRGSEASRASDTSRGPRSHPENEVRCPYCGTVYVLKD